MAVVKKQSFDTWYGTAAEKATFTSMAAGDKFIETDTVLKYEYTGAAWIISTEETTAITEADGANVTLGTKADVAATIADLTPFSVVSLLKGILNKMWSLGTQISTDQTLSWLASALINTTKTATFTKSTKNAKEHEIIIANQSTATALNVDIGNIETNMGFNAATDSLKNVLTSIVVPASTAAVIEDCEDAWNEETYAEVTATASTTAAALAVGTNSAKFAVTDVFTTGIIGCEAISATNLSKYTHVYAWVYSTIAWAAGELQLLLDNTAKCVSPLETISLPAIAATTLTRVRLPLANPDTDLAIISIGIQNTVDKNIAFDLHIDDVNAVKMSVASTLVQGWKNNMDGYVRVDNASALTAVQAFSAKIRVKELA